MTKTKILRMLNRHLNKPQDYHFVCYGGSSVLIVDEWSHKNTFKCRYQGDKNWMASVCEKCKGLTQKDKRLTHVQTMENYVLNEFAKDIIQELENES